MSEKSLQKIVQKGKNSHKMDTRCPRQLEGMPEAFCPLAVQRLKALRYTDKEVTEDEEALLSGCPWAVAHQLANYCFFKLVNDYLPDKQVSEMEVAHFCNLSVDSVKQIEKASLKKMRDAAAFKDATDDCGMDK